MFSYTESDVEGNLIGVRPSRWLENLERSRLQSVLSAGYRFLYIHQDVFGYSGWQVDIYDMDNDGDDEERTVQYQSDSLHVLEYWILYNMPSAGLTFEFAPSDVFRASLTALYTMVFVYDYDDHILRSKESTAFGVGHGFATSLSLRFAPKAAGFGAAGSGRIYFEIEGEYAWNRTDARQRQYWYGDLDTSASKGTEVGNIPHLITSSIGKAAIAVGFSF